MPFPLYLAAVATTMAAGFFALSRWFSRRRRQASAPSRLAGGVTATAFGSQAGGMSVISYCYTDLPWKLMMADMYQFARLAWAVPYILLPMCPSDSDDLDELALTWKNAFCVVVHVVLAVLQLLFLVSLPLAALFPVWVVALGVSGFLLLNHVLCMLLNSRDTEFTSDPCYAPALPEHAREQWIFLNGVAVGEHWMKNNLNRLALTFKRPIRGIHNRTSGILFDIIECLVQRNFQYATSDVRMCYSLIKETLHDDRFDKVVFILHSQGGIEGGLVLDWLLQELPQELLSRLEVYTFGCAANHFNNPRRHAHSEAERRGGREEANGAAVPPQPNGRAERPSRPSRRTPRPADAVASDPDAAATWAPALITETSSKRPSKISDRVIGHIEHYAHTFDFVALWGVLHFTSAAHKSQTMPRFIGRVFARSSDRGGHQFNLHYLNGMYVGPPPSFRWWQLLYSYG